MWSEKTNLIPWILIIGALIIAFAFFSFTVLGWCNHHGSVTGPVPPTVISYDDKYSACISLESHSVTFQYKAELGGADGTNYQTECVICLTQFKEEESLRKLHSCKHIFHTCCIDKWLGSHSGCPLCRTQIDKVENSPNGTVRLEETSHMMLVTVNS